MSVEDWAEIRRLHRSEKLSQAAIARQLGLSRNTVANALASEAPPRYEWAPVTTSAWAQVELACGCCWASTRRCRHR
jgi:transposase